MRRGILLICSMVAAFAAFWLLHTQISAKGKDLAVYLEPAPSQQIENTQQFPFNIPGTTLCAERIVSYDGWVAEGEIGFEATNTAALLLYNYGTNGITEAEIMLESGAVQLVFAVDTIPAGERVLVPEKTGKGYGPTNFTAYSGWQRDDNEDWLQETRLRLGFPDMGCITVTNLTDQILHGITLHYKNYLPEASFYVGGKTNKYYVERIEPGETICIYPLNYAFGYSKIARIYMDNP